MARIIRQVRGSRGRTAYKWCGGSDLSSPALTPVVANIIPLCPSVSAAEYSDVTVLRTILMFSVRRILTTAFAELAFVMWEGKVLDGTSTPVEAVDPLSTNTFSYADTNVMHWQQLPVPPNMEAFDGGAALTQEVQVTMVDIKAKRRLRRQNHEIHLLMGSGLNAAVQVRLQWRLLMSYGKR